MEQLDFNGAVAYIDSFLRFGSKLGLKHITMLLQKLGNPQDQLKFIHVAGTNGKGSTCAYIANILQCAGYKTGLFISPYVLDFRERFQINGQWIEKEKLAHYTSIVKAAVETMERQDWPTEFELITAIAFVYFLNEGCDVVVLEVGLGGRFDSTNVIKTPLCSVICSISFDHTDILGDTIEQIASEKAGIIKEGGKTVCYPQPFEAARKVIRKTAMNKHNAFVLVDPQQVRVESESLSGTKMQYRQFSLTLKLPGVHQPLNAATAIEAILQCALPVPDTAIETGIGQTVFPARCEVLRHQPPVILDGAHNLDGVTDLVGVLSQLEQKCVAIMGMMRDKDANGVLKILSPYFEKIITVTVSNPRSFSAAELKAVAQNYCSDVVAAPDVSSAAAMALCAGLPVCACGSFYFASEIRPFLL